LTLNWPGTTIRAMPISRRAFGQTLGLGAVASTWRGTTADDAT